jgi:hypothetical protein
MLHYPALRPTDCRRRNPNRIAVSLSDDFDRESLECRRFGASRATCATVHRSSFAVRHFMGTALASTVRRLSRVLAVDTKCDSARAQTKLARGASDELGRLVCLAPGQPASPSVFGASEAPFFLRGWSPSFPRRACPRNLGRGRESRTFTAKTERTRRIVIPALAKKLHASGTVHALE